jgi:hypothetical protein
MKEKEGGTRVGGKTVRSERAKPLEESVSIAAAATCERLTGQSLRAETRRRQAAEYALPGIQVLWRVS